MRPGSLDRVLCWCVLAASAAAQNVWHVNRSAAPGGDGAAWASAFDSLDDAFAAAALSTGTDEIRIARGTYAPSVPTDPARPRSATFLVVSGVHLHGGWNAATNQPPPAGVWNGTVLSGELGPAGRALHVVTVAPFDESLDPAVVISNLVVRGGAANDASSGDTRGGGLFARSAVVSLRSVHFTNNSAAGDGAAAFFEGYTTDIAFCRFSANSAQGAGGAVYARAELRCYNSMFVANSAVTGGGAAIDTQLVPGPNPVQRVVGCRFKANSALQFGGALAFSGYPGLDASAYRVINCTMSGNSAGAAGGAIYALPSDNGFVLNSVLWGDSATLDAELPGGLLVDSSDIGLPGGAVYPGWLGPSNINADPLLTPGLLIGSLASACVDRGRLSSLPPDFPDCDGDGIVNEALEVDCRRDPRVSSSGALDMGAHEMQP